MMKKQMQKAVCLLLGSVLLLSMGACGKKDKTSARDVTDGSSVTATQTTQVVREIKSHKGEIGEEMQYQGWLFCFAVPIICWNAGRLVLLPLMPSSTKMYSCGTM